MVAIVAWLIFSTGGVAYWVLDGIDSRRNARVVDQRDKAARLLAKAETVMNNLRASAFVVFEAIGIAALLKQVHAFRPTPAYLRYFNDLFQAGFVYAAFVLALNGAIYFHVNQRIRKGKA